MCSGVAWEHAYANTTALLREASAGFDQSDQNQSGQTGQNQSGSLVHARVPMGVYFAQHWETLLTSAPSLLNAKGGDVVTVVGAGFGDPSGYACLVSVQEGNVSVVSPATLPTGGTGEGSQISRFEIVCEMRPWVAGSGVARFSLLHLGTEVPAQTPTPSNLNSGV